MVSFLLNPSQQEFPIPHHRDSIQKNIRLFYNAIQVNLCYCFTAEGVVIADCDVACAVDLLILQDVTDYFRSGVCAYANFSDVIRVPARPYQLR
jgi:hypothetical protein